MKVRKLLGISLLAGSLLLTSCEDLLKNFMGGNSKKSSEDTSEHIQGYQGEQGKTELTKEEWNAAFSLEEFALRRSCHVDIAQTTTAMSSDVDNGKMHYELIYNRQAVGEGYLHFNYMDKNGLANVTLYSPSSDGTYEQETQSVPLDLMMAELAIISYDYNDFTYSVSSKTYSSPKFTYTVNYQNQQALQLVGENATIAIKDGFPSLVMFNIVNGEENDIDSNLYEAVYSNYNKTVVTLPDDNGGNNNNNNGGTDLPDPEGEEITFKQFYDAFKKRPEANFNHSEYQMVINYGSLLGDEDMNITGSQTLRYGMWEEDGETDYDIDMSSMILTDESLDGYDPTALGEEGEVSFYYNAKNKQYIIRVDYQLSEAGISANMYYNEYFYGVREEMNLGGEMSATVEIKWSTVTLPNEPMNVANRVFVGVDILEKDYPYYDAAVLGVSGITLKFDNKGQCALQTTKVFNGNEVSNTEQTMSGTYFQEGSTVTVTFTHYSNETVTSQELNEPITYEFTVSEDTVIMDLLRTDDNGQQVTIHAVLKFEEKFSGYIYIPSPLDNPTNEHAGTYSFKECKVQLINQDKASEAREAVQTIMTNEEELQSIFFNISEYDQTIIFYQDRGAYIGTYEINNNTMAIHFTEVYTTEGETVSVDQDYTVNYLDGEIYMVLLATEDYIIYGVYSRQA